MKQTKRLNIAGLLCNILMIAAVICCFTFAVTSGKVTISADSLKYFPVLTTIISALGAFLMIWSNIVSIVKKHDCTPRLFFSIRFLSAAMGLINLLGAIALMYAQNSINYDVFKYETGALFFNFIIPGISILQFILFEIQPKAKFWKTLEPAIAVLIYGFAIIIGFLVINSNSGSQAAHNFVYPYFFFCLTPETAAIDGSEVWKNVVWLILFLLVTYVGSFVIWSINRIISTIFVGVEIKTISEKESNKNKKEKVEEESKLGKIKNYISDSVSFKSSQPAKLSHVYHISFHDRKAKTWKVKSAGAGRALKIFPNQKEAINYARGEVEKHGGSIRIHSMAGKMRKAIFWDE